MYCKINHPNIVRFYGVGYDPDTEHGYLVTEYCAKGSLTAADERARPRGGATALLHANELGRQGYGVLPRRDFVHRDLKPDNVLDMTGVKLHDFGWTHNHEM